MARTPVTVPRPEIWNILLAGADGSLATHSRESTAARRAAGVVPEADFLHLKSLVAQCDAVLMGARTLAAERGAFRVSDLRAAGEPLWAIFTASGSVDPNHPFWRQAGIPRALCFCSDFSLSPQFHSETRDLCGSPAEFLLGSLGGVLAGLHARGVRRAALLGGGELNAHFWRAGVVDRLFLTVSPCLIGGGVHLLGLPLVSPVPLHLEKCEQQGELVFLEYAKRFGRLKVVEPGSDV